MELKQPFYFGQAIQVMRWFDDLYPFKRKPYVSNKSLELLKL